MKKLATLAFATALTLSLFGPPLRSFAQETKKEKEVAAEKKTHATTAEKKTKKAKSAAAKKTKEKAEAEKKTTAAPK